MIYLDDAAAAPVRGEVLEAMWPHLTGGFANPASRHEPGLAAEQALAAARKTVAAQLGARPAEIVFTSGGTESDNAAIKGIVLAQLAPGQSQGAHVLISAAEHPAVSEAAHWLTRFGITVEELPVDSAGLVDPEDLRAALREDTLLVSIHYANSEVGTVQDIPTLAGIAAERGVPFHTDAVQAAGALPLDVTGLGVSAMSLSGHKLGTPKGIGALYLRRRTPYEPLMHGGGQQRGLRSGTENVAAAVGLATALQRADTEDNQQLAGHRDAFIQRVEMTVPGARLTGHRTRRLPGHASFVIAGRSGESLLLDLEARGIFCSSGSACHAGDEAPSPVLTAMGFSPEVAQTALRFSWGPGTPVEQLVTAAEALAASVSPGVGSPSGDEASKRQ
ncbi:cysteine desulfurase family protein [Nesterenkonia alba]|uniref:cysteine desulfurase family protein n=1 Tax=Nesterenkonia alba TaxID=515814 RepID=UPI0003B3F293|nr:cysteine desulfurase family protein [Nesterenkonia alba]